MIYRHISIFRQLNEINFPKNVIVIVRIQTHLYWSNINRANTPSHHENRDIIVKLVLFKSAVYKYRLPEYYNWFTVLIIYNTYNINYRRTIITCTLYANLRILLFFFLNINLIKYFRQYLADSVNNNNITLVSRWSVHCLVLYSYHQNIEYVMINIIFWRQICMSNFHFIIYNLLIHLQFIIYYYFIIL